MEPPFKLILKGKKCSGLWKHTKNHAHKVWRANYINVTTLIETRRAMTLLSADRIPAIIGININFRPKIGSVWDSELSRSSQGKFLLSLQHLWRIWKVWKTWEKTKNKWNKRYFRRKLCEFKIKITVWVRI